MNLAQRLSSPPVSTAKPGSTSRADLVLRLLTFVTIVGFAIGIYFALVYAGTEANQGNVQRIFYFHVAAFSSGAIAFAAAVFGGIAYLRTRRVFWDQLALAGVEVGFSLSLITLITGMTWARPIWNTWWTWDPRLTSAAIMVLTYAAYFMLRGAMESPDKKRAMAAVYGILAFATVIFTFAIIRIRPDTIHPTVIGTGAEGAEGSFAMSASMRAALAANSAIWCCLIAPTLVWWRIRLARLQEQADRLRAQL